MRGKRPLGRDNESHNGLPVRLRPEIEAKARIAERQSAKKE